MRVLLWIPAVLLLSSCGVKTETATNQNATAPPAAKPERAAEATAAAKGDASAAPVDLTVLGITPDKASVSYRIKVNADKPIEEVHLALKETDGSGKVVADTTIIWQNIVGSTRKPIEKGIAYEDHSTLDSDVVKAEVTLKEVVFKDGTRWRAH
jgi:hypothetical protein